jgi:hypothetical protein
VPKNYTKLTPVWAEMAVAVAEINVVAELALDFCHAEAGDVDDASQKNFREPNFWPSGKKYLKSNRYSIRVTRLGNFLPIGLLLKALCEFSKG